MRAVILALASFVALSACELIAPTNGFDPDTPSDQQAAAHVDVTVKDTNANLLTSGVSVTVEGSAANVDIDDDDGDGVFAKDLVPGRYTIVVTAAGAGVATRDVELFAGEVRAMTIVVAADASQLGTVRGKARKESQLTVESPDHSGVIVEALVDGVSTGVRAVTNAEGRYDLSLLAGTYTLSFSAADHEAQTRPNVVVSAGVVTDVEPLTLEVNPGSIDGTVALEDLDDTDDVTPSPAGVLIALVGASVTTTAAADGSYRITGLPPGNQTLRLSFADHVAVEVPVVVRAGTTGEIAAVTLLRERGTLFGSVDVVGAGDDSGVLIEADGSGVIDVTGLDGLFALAVPTGTWNVSATKPGTKRARATSLVVAAGVSVDVGVLRLAPNVGTLVIDDGSGVTNDDIVSLVFDEDDAVSVRASEDPAFADVEFVAFPADGSLDFSLSAGDGTKAIFAQIKDGNGEVKSLSGSVVKDTSPPLLESIDVASLTTSVSITVGVLGADADEMAIATDGTVDNEIFTPFAATSIALLPPGDGIKTVCVVLRDDAGNTTSPLCTNVTLETAAPVAPRVVIRGRLADGAVLTSAEAIAFQLELLPFSGASNDVVAIVGTIESKDSDFGVASADIDIACADDGTGVVRCDDGVDPPGVPIDLFTDTLIDDDTRPNLVRLRARDRAGNVSGDTSLTIIVDDTLPAAPTPSDPLRVRCPLPAAPAALGVRCAGDVYELVTPVNSDSFTLQLNEQPGAIDATFSRYFVARTVGEDLTEPSAAAFAPTASVDNIVFALVQGAPLNGSPVTATCNPLRCTNHLWLTAVDLANNHGPTMRIDVTEDSSPPTRPLIAPRGGAQRGTLTEVRLVSPALDRGGPSEGGDAVHAYEIKQGTDGAFGGVPAGQDVTGPWHLAVVENDISEVCVRGVDDAGNVGIEDCIDVEEQTVRHPIASELSDRRVLLGSTRMAAVVGRDLVIHPLANPDINAAADAAAETVVANLNNPGLLHGSSVFNPATGLEVFDVVVGVGNGKFGFVADGVGFRLLCGNNPETNGANIIFENGGRLRSATRAAAIAVATSASDSGSCTTVASTDLGAIGSLCAGTDLRIEGNVAVWCETAGQTSSIKRKDITTGLTAPTVLTSNPAPTNSGIFGGFGGPQQPVVSSTATWFAENNAAGTATIRRVAHGGNLVVDTGVETAQLQDADGDHVAILALRSGLVDVAVVDVSQAPATTTFFTDDPAPQSQVSIDGSRVAFVDLAALTEDIGLVDTTTSRWLIASPDTETLASVGEGVVTWVTFDSQLVVHARIETGSAISERELVVLNLAAAPSPADLFTFIGGTPLGPQTLGAAGRRVFVVHENANPANVWSLNAIDVDTGAVTLATADMREIDTTNAASTATWGPSTDGSEVVTVNSAGELRLSRFVGATARNTRLGAAPGIVPFVDVDALATGAGVAVAQIGNINPNGSGGDGRRSFVGNLTCFAHDANGNPIANTGGVIQRASVPLVGRAPVVAFVGAKLFMAYQESNASNQTRTHVCELTCGAAPACTNDVPLGINGDDPPTISRTGLVVWQTFAASGSFGDVAVYDVTSSRLRLLTSDNGELASHDFVSVSGDRAVWVDGRFDNFDVFESIIDR